MPLIRDAVDARARRRRARAPDHVIVSSPHARAAATAAQAARRGARRRRGSGTPAPPTLGLRLAAVLDRAKPGETILIVSAADGCDAACCGSPTRSPTRRARRPVAEQLERGREVAYATYLTWRGLLEREPPRRPDPERPAGPPAARAEALEVRVRRVAVHRVRARPRPAAARVRRLRRGRSDGARAAGRQAGDGRHVHRRPAGVLALAADDRRGRRLRRRRAVHARGDRRRARARSRSAPGSS